MPHKKAPDKEIKAEQKNNETDVTEKVVKAVKNATIDPYQGDSYPDETDPAYRADAAVELNAPNV